VRAGTTADPGCTSLRWALALLEGLVGGGVRRLVLSPGSRSTPVVLAAQRASGLELFPVLDERSAAFFALGMARAAGRPVALLATSGSAPAHWLPAVVEAHAAAVPLVLLSADRPPELRAWGANQTVDQTRLFGAFVLEFHDPGRPDDTADALKAMRALGARAAAVSRGRRPGPVHINLPFPEPLVAQGDCATEVGPVADATPRQLAQPPLALSGPGTLGAVLRGRGLIVCGPGTASEGVAGPFWGGAARLALPALVDPLSGLRFGPAEAARITRYDSLLRNPEAARRLRPDWVIRFGGAPVSKTLLDWLKGTPTVLVDPGGQWRDPTHDVLTHIDADPALFCDWLATSGLVEPDPEWLGLWSRAEARVDALAGRHLGASPWCEAQAIRALLERLPADAALFTANSLPVRQLDTWSGARPAPLAIYGNRGASGIDGNVSTLAGLNAAGVPTLGLLGDLALTHDLGGLLLAERLRLPLIVIGNGGGRIFDYLPQHGLPGFEAFWRTPVAPAMGKLAALFDLPYRQAAEAATFGTALDDTLEAGRPALIELRIDAEASRAVHMDFWRLVRQESLVSG
jgi:2-succinyl-5-enolpyruvyl-6-hydroxy-3-cyclohexene-1-carboxylate synthase